MNIRNNTDKELVILLRQNDEKAFSELYLRYKDKLYFLCLTLLKSKEEANDIVQEIFIRLWESRLFLDSELSISSYLYTIARNRVINYFRDIDVDEKVKQIILTQKNTEEEAIDSKIIYTEYQQILQNAISLLPPRRKEIFNMSRIENLSHKEIATQLGISINTVQEHISEALKFIKLYFNKHADISLSILLIMMV